MLEVKASFTPPPVISSIISVNPLILKEMDWFPQTD